MSDRLLYVTDLGLVDYDEAWAFQRSAAQLRIKGKHAKRDAATEETNDALPNDLLILCEHPPVVTLGRSTKPGNLLASPAYLDAVGVQLREVERGGDVTIHEPGQLVAYPIIDLEQHRKDLHWYLRQVEEAVIVSLATFGLTAGRVEGLTGVWIDNRKIASIGVHARDWVTWHGVALNVHNDLSTFTHVVPCGIDQVTMTTVHRECVAASLPVPSMDSVRAALTAAFAQVFALTAAELPGALAEKTRSLGPA